MTDAVQNGDGFSAPIVMDFDAIFDAHIKATGRVWDRSQTAGASEVFSCIRKVWFEKLGRTFGQVPDEDYVEDWGAMLRGTLYEEHHIAPAIKTQMPLLVYPTIEVLYSAADAQGTLVSGRASATPDGLIDGLPFGCSVRVRAPRRGVDITIPNIQSDCIVIEFKTIDPRANLIQERQKHHDQTQVQLGAFHELTAHKPHYSIILYVDASFLSIVTPFVVEYNPDIYPLAKQRADQIYAAKSPGELEPEGRFSGDCEYCKWCKACGTERVNRIPQYDKDETATPETIEKMDGLVKAKQDAENAFKEAENALELAKEKIKDFLLSRNTSKMKGPGWTVTWYSSEGKKSLDQKALVASGVDLEPFMRQGAPFDTVRITPTRQKSEIETSKPRSKGKSK